MNATPRQLVDIASNRPASLGIIMPHAIGDSFYLMVLLRNLLQRGHTLTLFGGVIQPLRDWFPFVHFVPDPAAADLAGAFDSFDQVIQMFPRKNDGSALSAPDWPAPPHLLRLPTLPAFGDRAHVLESMLRIGQQQFGVPAEALTTCGITVPARFAHLVHRRHANRVIIHPVASIPFKAWDLAKFVTLARRLKARGLSPCFVVPPADGARWQRLAPDIAVAAFDDMNDLAALIYESGWFIGNDSGIGHLASAMDLPTLSLFPRAGLARRWRPGWGVNEVILPLPLLVSAKLKERFWRPLLPVGRVMAAFDKLQARARTQLSVPAAHALPPLHSSQTDA